MSITLIKVKNLVHKDIKQIEKLLQELANSKLEIINEVAQYILSSGGKRIRPIIMSLIGHALKIDQQQFRKLAAITELIHTATLLHDDVVDESSTRRNKPTINYKYDNPTAILVGDFLYTKAFQLLSSFDNLPLLKLYIDAINQISEGEVLQLINIGQTEQTIETYLEIIYNKTGCLFQAGTTGVAMLSMNPDETVLKQAADYGKYLGIAFQMIDDYLDYANNENWTKESGDDLSQGKITLALLHLAEHGTTEDKQLVQDIIAKKLNRNHFTQIKQRLTLSGSLEYCKQQAQLEINKAKQALDNWPSSTAKTLLLDLADMVIDRDK